MQSKQLIGITGSILLLVGVFTPVLNAPVIGSVNYLEHFTEYGVTVLVLAATSFILTLSNRFRWLWSTGIGALIILTSSFISFYLKVSHVKTQLIADMRHNPFIMIAYAVLESIKFQWGWALLAAGASLIIASAAIKENKVDSTREVSDVDHVLFNRERLILFSPLAVITTFALFLSIKDSSVIGHGQDAIGAAKAIAVTERKVYTDELTEVEPEGAFTLDDLKWEVEKSGIDYVVGVVKNNTSRKFASVTISFKLYDITGTSVGGKCGAMALVYDLEPFSRKEFKGFVLGEPAHRATSARVKGIYGSYT